MPFDEENNDQQSIHSQKVGLKKVSTQQSIFDQLPKKPTQDDLNQNVKKIQDRESASKKQAADLALKFYHMMADKTLPENKNQFQKELELELLKDMINFGNEINNDASEKEGIGSISLIALMLKNCISQRDKINNLEYSISKLEKKHDAILKEIDKVLDIKKQNG